MKLGRKAFFFRFVSIVRDPFGFECYCCRCSRVKWEYSSRLYELGYWHNWPQLAPCAVAAHVSNYRTEDHGIVDGIFMLEYIGILEIFPFNLCTVSFCITLIRHTAAYRFNDENVALSALPHLSS